MKTAPTIGTPLGRQIERLCTAIADLPDVESCNAVLSAVRARSKAISIAADRQKDAETWALLKGHGLGGVVHVNARHSFRMDTMQPVDTPAFEGVIRYVKDGRKHRGVWIAPDAETPYVKAKVGKRGGWRWVSVSDLRYEHVRLVRAVNLGVEKTAGPAPCCAEWDTGSGMHSEDCAGGAR